MPLTTGSTSPVPTWTCGRRRICRGGSASDWMDLIDAQTRVHDARLTTTGEALWPIPPLRDTLNLGISYGGFTMSWSDRGITVDT